MINLENYVTMSKEEKCEAQNNFVKVLNSIGIRNIKDTQKPKRKVKHEVWLIK